MGKRGAPGRRGGGTGTVSFGSGGRAVAQVDDAGRDPHRLLPVRSRHPDARARRRPPRIPTGVAIWVTGWIPNRSLRCRLRVALRGWRRGEAEEGSRGGRSGCLRTRILLPKTSSLCIRCRALAKIPFFVFGYFDFGDERRPVRVPGRGELEEGRLGREVAEEDNLAARVRAQLLEAVLDPGAGDVGGQIGDFHTAGLPNDTT